MLGGRSRARKDWELVEQNVELGGHARVARGAQASAQFGTGRLDAEQVQQRALWIKGRKHIRRNDLFAAGECHARHATIALGDGGDLCARANLGTEAARSIGDCADECTWAANGNNGFARCATVGAVTRDAVKEERCAGAWRDWPAGVVARAAPRNECLKVVVVDVLVDEVSRRHWEHAQNLATIALFEASERRAEGEACEQFSDRLAAVKIWRNAVEDLLKVGADAAHAAVELQVARGDLLAVRTSGEFGGGALRIAPEGNGGAVRWVRREVARLRLHELHLPL